MGPEPYRATFDGQRPFLERVARFLGGRYAVREAPSDDLAALKNSVTGFCATVDGFSERLSRQAEALRSMFAAYSQRETQLEQLVDGLTRLRTNPAPPSGQF